MARAQQAARQPARGDEGLHPGQDDDRAHADAREGEAHGQAAPAHEPVGQEERLTGVAETDAAAAHHHPEGGVEVPGLAHQGGQHQPGRHEADAHLQHHPRPAAVHQPAEGRAQHRRDEKPERERAGRHPALPAELVEDRREEQGEGGARVDADAHGDEDDAHDDPAVEEGQAHEPRCYRVRSKSVRQPIARLPGGAPPMPPGLRCRLESVHLSSQVNMSLSPRPKPSWCLKPFT